MPTLNRDSEFYKKVLAKMATEKAINKRLIYIPTKQSKEDKMLSLLSQILTELRKLNETTEVVEKLRDTN